MENEIQIPNISTPFQEIQFRDISFWCSPKLNHSTSYYSLDSSDNSEITVEIIEDGNDESEGNIE